MCFGYAWCWSPIFFLSCFKYLRARQNNDILIFKWRRFVSVRDPLTLISYEPQDPTCKSYLAFACRCRWKHIWNWHPASGGPSLLPPQGKPPELTHRRHIAPHAECFGLPAKRRRAGSAGHVPARPARLREGLGLRRQRCHFCGLWIRPITSRAGKTHHHQNRSATHRKSQHLEQPLSRISEQDRKRQMWDTRKVSSDLLQWQETGPIPLPTAPPAQHSPNAARPPAAIPGAALQGRRFACPAPGEMLV